MAQLAASVCCSKFLAEHTFPYAGTAATDVASKVGDHVKFDAASPFLFICVNIKIRKM